MKKWLLPALAGAALAVGIGLYFWHQRADDPSADEPARDHPPGFRDVAREAGITFRMAFLPEEQGEKFKINLYDHGSGVAVGDFDGDGHDDVYFVNQLGPNALYRNRGDGTFEDVTARAGVALGDRVCVAATFADTRNNGRQDLFVTSTRGGNVFFRNRGDGTFREATKEAGLVHVGHSQAAVFFDYDNDGYLDLLVTNTAGWTTDTFDPVGKYYRGGELIGSDRLFQCPPESNLLYHNNGDGTFTDVTAKSGLKGRGWSGDVAVFDYNGDGYLDVAITNMFGPTQLFRNNGDGTFTDVTRAVLGPTSFGATGARVFGIANDGLLDLLLVDMHSDMWMGLDASHSSLDLARAWERRKYPHLRGPVPLDPARMAAEDREFARRRGYRAADVVYGNTFFKNLGAGKFQELSDQAGLETFWPWGAAAGDFNNDGFEDVFMTAGMGHPFYYWPNYLLMNNGDGTFTNRATEEGIEPPRGGIYLEEKIGGHRACRSSRSAATADFDGDGRLDLVVNNFNGPASYFRNAFPRRNYLAFRLTGTHGNRDAIGALVKLYVPRADGSTEVMVRQVNPAAGYLAQSSKTIHFGLGSRPQVERVEIRWPRGGLVQTLKDPAINRLHRVTEPTPPAGRRPRARP